MKKTILIIGVFSLLLFSISALAENVTVEVSHNSLQPSSLTIYTGDTVTFHNRVNMPGGHTIVSEDGGFKSPALAKNESWSHTFDRAGTYHFTIVQHPDAKGEIVVKDKEKE